MSPPSHHPSQPIYRVAQLRQIEAGCLNPDPPLMERAGAAAAHLAMAITSGSRLPALIVCGPGNNGGDGFVVARILKQRGVAPVVVFRGDSVRLPADARAAFEAWRASGGEVLHDIPQREFSLVVDALFGIGLTRPLEGEQAALIEAINHIDCPVLSLDIPSGLHADTGSVLGCAVRADYTATFIALKPGLLTLDGPDYCGDISVHDLDLNPASIVTAEAQVVGPALFSEWLQPRRKNSHKGMMGSVGIIGGASGMVGAALLAGRAALKMGAGRIYVGLIDHAALTVDTCQPELMLRTPQDVLGLVHAGALAVGPGLGQSVTALDLLKRAIAGELPLVLDADALNLIAMHPVLAKQVARRAAPTLMTPHPLEAARLLGMSFEDVRGDRIKAAQTLAQNFKAAVVLKGAGSVIALPTDAANWYINTSGNPGMATGGMGDVLTGIAAALLAQGWRADKALLCAVHLHGLAADHLVEQGIGPAGMTAGETIDAARALFNGWANSSPRHA